MKQPGKPKWKTWVATAAVMASFSGGFGGTLLVQEFNTSADNAPSTAKLAAVPTGPMAAYEQGATSEQQLVTAIQFNDFQSIRQAVEKKGANLDFENGTPLRLAATYGMTDIIRYMDQRGADLRIDNDIALRKAAAFGHIEAVEYLTARGADITANNNEALRAAALYNYTPVVDYLLAQGADPSADNNAAFQGAVTFGNADMARLLIKNGAVISNGERDEALKTAAYLGHLDMVRFLVNEQRADLHTGRDMPLYHAATNGRSAVVAFLLDRGATPTIDMVLMAKDRNDDVTRMLQDALDAPQDKISPPVRGYKAPGGPAP